LVGGKSRTYGPNTVQPGQYSVTESTPPSGWDLQSLTCLPASGLGTSVTTSLATATATITMAAGGSVDCTYTNHLTLSPGISTTVFDATTKKVWSGSEVAGASAYDTATLTGATSTASGTVTYYFFGAGKTCIDGKVPAAGAFTSSSTASVTNGLVGVSATVGPLAVGSYGPPTSPVLKFTETGLSDAESALVLVSPFDVDGQPLTVPVKTVKTMAGC
jgi:hypothetical protein